MKAAATTIGKRSASVVLTGPAWTAKKIGSALFPCLALPIRQLVTLRSSKAPITVCESALADFTPQGKRFSLLLSTASPLHCGPVALYARPSWIYRLETDSGRGMPGSSLQPSPTCRLSGSSRRSGCVPAEPYPPLEHLQSKPSTNPKQYQQ